MKLQGCPGAGWAVHLRAGLASGTQFKETLSPAVNNAAFKKFKCMQRLSVMTENANVVKTGSTAHIWVIHPVLLSWLHPCCTHSLCQPLHPLPAIALARHQPWVMVPILAGFPLFVLRIMPWAIVLLSQPFDTLVNALR